MTHANREDQKRHKNRERIQAETEERQGAQLPNDRDQRAEQRRNREGPSTRVAPDQERNNKQRDPEQHEYRTGSAADIAHHFGKADDVYLDGTARVAFDS